MNGRPNLDKELNGKIFRSFYYLKEELTDFCRRNDLQATGGKIELTNRIAQYLDTGEKTYHIHTNKKNTIIDKITLETIIEENFVCSEKHRAFYKEHIGNRFSFNVIFQKWLKNNALHFPNLSQEYSYLFRRSDLYDFYYEETNYLYFYGIIT